MALGKCSAIILKTDPFFEHDKRSECFTDSFGKITCLAKYAQKSKQRAWALEPLSIVELELFKGKSFYSINHYTVTHYFNRIRESFNHLQYGIFFCNIIKQSVMTEQQHLHLFNLLKTTLIQLNNLPDIQQAAIQFYQNLIHIEGIQTSAQLPNNEQHLLSIISNYTNTLLKKPLQLPH